MRFRAKGFRDQRAVKLQEGESWPNQMHAVPQPVGKMQRDCLRQKGPRWVNDSSKDPWSSKVVWKGVAGTTARRKYETGTSYKKAEGEASRSSWSAPAAPATSPRAISDVIGVWILDPCRWGLVGSWREFSRGSQPSPYMVEKLILRDGFADDEWCWCSKWDVFRHGECPTCRRSRCPSSWRCSVEWGGKRTGAAEPEVGVKRKTWFPYCRSDHHEQGRSGRSGSGGGSAVGLEEKTHTVDEHSRGRRVWNKFEEIGLGALLNQFEKIGLEQLQHAKTLRTPARSWLAKLPIPKYYNLLLRTTKYYKLLESTRKYYKVLQSMRKYCKVPESTTKSYYSILQSPRKF